MFNWVCPRCGKDVPPSKTECPFCAEAATAPLPAPLPPQYAPQTPPYAPVPQPAPPAVQPIPQQPQYGVPAPPQYAPTQYAPQPPGWPPPPRQGAPTWLLGVAFGLAFVGIFAAIYLYLNHEPSSAPAAAPTTAAAAPAAPNPLQKYIEVAGVRLVTENKKPTARFVVVNHSGAEMAGVTGKVTLLAGNSRSDARPVGTFNFTVKSLPASGSAELSAPFATEMKAYELPDWQASFTQVEVTSPAP